MISLARFRLESNSELLQVVAPDGINVNSSGINISAVDRLMLRCKGEFYS